MLYLPDREAILGLVVPPLEMSSPPIPSTYALPAYSATSAQPTCLLRNRVPWKAILLIALYLTLLLSGVEQFRTTIQQDKLTGTFKGGVVHTTSEVVSLVARSWVVKPPERQ